LGDRGVYRKKLGLKSGGIGIRRRDGEINFQGRESGAGSKKGSGAGYTLRSRPDRPGAHGGLGAELEKGISVPVLIRLRLVHEVWVSGGLVYLNTDKFSCKGLPISVAQIQPQIQGLAGKEEVTGKKYI